MSLERYMKKTSKEKREQREVLKIVKDWSGLSKINSQTVHSLSLASNYKTISLERVKRCLSSLLSNGLLRKEDEKYVLTRDGLVFLDS